MAKPKQLTTADLVVLSFILAAPPMHGYQLIGRLEAADFEDWVAISRPQVYYSLRKLAAAGLLEEDLGNAPSRGPERTVYRPGPGALETLREALDQPHWPRARMPSAFNTWIGLALHLPPASAARQLAARRAFLQAEIEREHRSYEGLEGIAGKDVALGRAMIRLGIGQMEAELAALAEVEQALTLAA